MSIAPLQAAWAACDPQDKCARVQALPPALDLAAEAPPTALGRPGRPAQPALLPPHQVPRRRLGSAAGRVALLHAIAHIEFNAINLALDAVLRFGSRMPADFAADWLSVARDEARHYTMLRARLKAHGADYGELPAHDGLWEAAEKTADDVLARMALVPRVLEARGLDVTPGMIARLEAVDAQAEADCLRVILAEEVRHVEIGTRWFDWLCQRRGLERVATFHALLAEHAPGARHAGPHNHAARAEAGFLRVEYLPEGVD